MTSKTLAWSCDERDRKNCRNPHGCHCSEITHLIAARDTLTADRDRVQRNRDMWKGQCERQAEQLTASQRPEESTDAAVGVAQAAPKLSDPHPHWSVENKNEDYPKSVDEWDPRKDPVGQHLALAEKRLRVAMDRDDPRAPEEMALISRWDLTTLVHDWWHKCAVFDLWLAERKAKEASLVSSTNQASAPQADVRAAQSSPCPYAEDGSECLLETHSFGPCLCANPVGNVIEPIPPSVALDAEQLCDLLMRLRDYLVINRRPGNDLNPKFSAEITDVLLALSRPQPGGAVAGTERGTP